MITSNDVAGKFQEFLDAYREFRQENGLTKDVDNIFEICTGLADKNGRICRQVKHVEREDPKPDFPQGLLESMSGYLFYMIMILSKYDLSLNEGIIGELEEAVKQYGEDE